MPRRPSNISDRRSRAFAPAAGSSPSPARVLRRPRTPGVGASSACRRHGPACVHRVARARIFRAPWDERRKPADDFRQDAGRKSESLSRGLWSRRDRSKSCSRSCSGRFRRARASHASRRRSPAPSKAPRPLRRDQPFGVCVDRPRPHSPRPHMRSRAPHASSSAPPDVRRREIVELAYELRDWKAPEGGALSAGLYEPYAVQSIAIDRREAASDDARAIRRHGVGRAAKAILSAASAEKRHRVRPPLRRAARERHLCRRSPWRSSRRLLPRQ